MTPFADGWITKQARSAPFIPIEILAGNGPLLVLTPHPDDESLGCGAAIAAASLLGYEVIVASLTDGAGSHPNSRAVPKSALIELRQKEMKEAVGVLTAGNGRTIALGIPDQGITAQSLAEHHTIEILQDVIASNRIATLWTTWREDPHVDHRHAAELAVKLAESNSNVELWQFPIWGRYAQTDNLSGAEIYNFDSRPFIELKRRAIAAHKSQMTDMIADDPSGFMMDPLAQAQFLECPEIFIGSSTRG